MENLKKTIEIQKLLQALVEEAKYFEEHDAPEYESTLVIHCYLRIFVESFGAENLETSGDTGFRDQFWATYGELNEEYVGKQPQTEDHWDEFLEMFAKCDPSVLALSAERILYTFFQAGLTGDVEANFIKNLKVDNEPIYKDIQQELRLESLENTKALVNEFFASRKNLNLYNWREYGTFDLLYEFVKPHDEV